MKFSLLLRLIFQVLNYLQHISFTTIQLLHYKRHFNENLCQKCFNPVWLLHQNEPLCIYECFYYSIFVQGTFLCIAFNDVKMWQIVIALLISDTVIFLLFFHWYVFEWMKCVVGLARKLFHFAEHTRCHLKLKRKEKKKKTVQIDRSILRTHMSMIWITVIRDVDIVFIYNFACSDYKRIIWLWNNKRNIYSVWRFRFFFLW